jgi:oligoendopeptidase F
VSLDLDSYRERAEGFIEELDREYYLHLAGHKSELEVEAIYERHGSLFERDAVERIGDARRASAGELGRRLRYLHQFALEGHLGAATRAEEARLAELEATLEVEVDGDSIPYRAAAIAQANAEDAERRAAIEAARNATLSERLTPLHRQMLERWHRICAELGWSSYLDAFADLRDLDLNGLRRQLDEFAAATAERYPAVVDPELEHSVGMPLARLRRSDLVRFFRAVNLDRLFPGDRLVDSFRETLAEIGIDLDSQANVLLDTESRPSKSPRAFCATPRVPEEVHLVVPPIGGREDFATLLHEGGHAEHYGNTEAALPFEFRHLGDNAVTESFAFLLEGLTADPVWLREVLGIEDPEAAVAHARAARLLMLRRYSAKIAYEVELHGRGAELEPMRDRYVELLSDRVGVAWPPEPWLSDVDPGFYVACYLRAWALELSWRRALRERFGSHWFRRPEAGEWLLALWEQGQRLSAEELLGETLGESLDFDGLASELTGI